MWSLDISGLPSASSCEVPVMWQNKTLIPYLLHYKRPNSLCKEVFHMQQLKMINLRHKAYTATICSAKENSSHAVRLVSVVRSLVSLLCSCSYIHLTETRILEAITPHSKYFRNVLSFCCLHGPHILRESVHSDDTAWLRAECWPYFPRKTQIFYSPEKRICLNFP